MNFWNRPLNQDFLKFNLKSELVTFHMYSQAQNTHTHTPDLQSWKACMRRTRAGTQPGASSSVVFHLGCCSSGSPPTRDLPDTVHCHTRTCDHDPTRWSINSSRRCGGKLNVYWWHSQNETTTSTSIRCSYRLPFIKFCLRKMDCVKQAIPRPFTTPAQQAHVGTIIGVRQFGEGP